MYILDDTDKSLEVKLGGAVTTNQLDWAVGYVDLLSSDQSVSAVAEADGQTNNTTAVTIIAAPASGHTRQLKALSVYNADTVAAEVIIQINHGGTARIIWLGTIQAGDTLQYSSGSFVAFASNTRPNVVLTTDVTGVLPTPNGGTGIANAAASTLAISGAYATTLTVTAVTGVTLPTTGTLATLAGTEELTNKTITAAVGKGTWTASGTWVLPSHTCDGDLTFSASTPTIQLGALVSTYGASIKRYSANAVYIGVPGATSSQSVNICTSSGSGVITAYGDGKTTFGSDIRIPATTKMYFDGGTHTYISESSGDVLDFYVGSFNTIKSSTSLITFGTGVDVTLSKTAVTLTLGTGVSSYGATIKRYSSDVLLIGIPGTTSTQSLSITTSAGGSCADFRGDAVLKLYGDLYIPTTNKIYLDGGGNSYIYEASADVIKIYSGGNPAFILGTGTYANACIGATAADNNYRLLVRGLNGSGTTTFSLYCVNSDSAAAFAVRDDLGVAISSVGKFYIDSGSDTYIYESSANVFGFVSAGTTAATLSSDSTSGLTMSQSIAGNFYPINLRNSSGGTSSRCAVWLGNDASQYHSFLIAYSSAHASYPSQLWIGTNVAAGAIGIYSGGALIAVTISSAQAIRFNAYGAGTLVTDASGNITASSDSRLKYIDGPYKVGLPEILQLEPIRFHWTKDSRLDTENEYVGFDASEVKKILPHAVGEDRDGFLTLSDRAILAALINAVKELDARVPSN